MISVIVATKLRPSLQTLLSSLRQQSLIYGKEWELLTRSDGINEYDARNKAAREAKGELFAFLDDDTYVDSDYLEKGKRHFEDAKIMVMDCALKGNFFGHGEEVIDKHGWGIGATLWVRREAFEKVGGFEATWQLNPRPRGWRSDTDLLWRIMDAYGDDSYYHADDMIVYHPSPGGSSWDVRVEKLFYLRHKERCLKLFLPVDPRLCQLVIAVDDDPVARAAAQRHLDEFIAAGLLTRELATESIKALRAWTQE
jgi:glycosyltransferase involved in cell wall biosynthesis